MPIVLVPGLLCTPEVFGPQIPALWPYGPVTIASTLTGASIAEIATNILKDAPPRFALAGISMGGFICMEITRQASERVTRLALLSTSAQPDTLEQTTRRRAMLAEAKMHENEFGPWIEEKVISTALPARRDEVNLREISRRMGLAVGLDGLIRQTEAMISRPDYRLILPLVRVPALVLVGDGDALTPPDRAEEIASLVPSAALVIASGCGHMSTLERPDQVSSALVAWLKN